MTLFKSIHQNKHSFCSKYQLCELNQRKEIDSQQKIFKQNNFCDFKFNSFEKILLAAHSLFSNPVVFWWMENTNFIVQWPWNSYNNVRFGRSYYSIYNRIFIGIKYISVIWTGLLGIQSFLYSKSIQTLSIV